MYDLIDGNIAYLKGLIEGSKFLTQVKFRDAKERIHGKTLIQK